MVNSKTTIGAHFKKIIQSHIPAGGVAAEFYHGDWIDILTAISEQVGKEGVVYGIDSLPTSTLLSPEDQCNTSQIKFVTTTLPSLPSEVANLDAIVIRELIWSYDLDSSPITPCVATYNLINSRLKNSGKFIINLNKSEQTSPGMCILYTKTVSTLLPHFTQVYFHEDALVYQKSK